MGGSVKFPRNKFSKTNLFLYVISGSVVSCAATNASNGNQSIPGPYDLVIRRGDYSIM